MFGISLEHFLILLVAGFFILGPQRLPEAAAWLGRTTRQVREYVHGAREQIRSELGPEFDELRKPLDDLNSLRRMNPKQMVGSYLLDDTGNSVGGSNGAVQGVPADPSQTSQPPQPDQPPTESRRPAADPDSHQTAAPTSPESGRNVP